MAEWPLTRGFRYAGVHCGIRPDPNRRDLALVISDVPAIGVGVFTQNRVRAAPVRICEERLPSDSVRGVVICSGNANACTGQRGLDDARRMTAVAAEVVGCHETEMLVCSTGVIGRHLPMPEVERGIRAAAPLAEATVDALDDMAHAILTTDTRTKVAGRMLILDGEDVRLTGVAKGAAMMGPNLATMLAFVFTDAKVTSIALQPMVRQAAAKSFNCISVEGHTSTNDTLLVLANGMSGGATLEGESLRKFSDAVTSVCGELARAIAADAEGATHLVTIEVEGTRTDAEAHRVAKTIADSALVKTAIFGADPNWGRIVSAAGYSGVVFEEEHLSLWMGDLLLYDKGTPQPFDPATASAYLKREREIHLRLRFTLGDGRCRFWTCDLTDEYVRLNADYTT